MSLTVQQCHVFLLLLLLDILVPIRCIGQSIVIETASSLRNLTNFVKVAPLTFCLTSIFYDKSYSSFDQYYNVIVQNEDREMSVDILTFPNMDNFNVKSNSISNIIPYNSPYVFQSSYNTQISTCTSSYNADIIYCGELTDIPNDLIYDVYCQLLIFDLSTESNYFSDPIPIFIDQNNNIDGADSANTIVKCLTDGNYIIFYWTGIAPITLYYSVLSKDGKTILNGPTKTDITYKTIDGTQSIIYNNYVNNQHIFYYQTQNMNEQFQAQRDVHGYMITYNNKTYDISFSNSFKIASENTLGTILNNAPSLNNLFLNVNSNKCCFVSSYISLVSSHQQYLYLFIVDTNGNIDINSYLQIQFLICYDVIELSLNVIGTKNNRYFIVTALDNVGYYAYIINLNYNSSSNTYSLSMIDQILLQVYDAENNSDFPQQISSQIINDNQMFVCSMNENTGSYDFSNIMGQTFHIYNKSVSK